MRSKLLRGKTLLSACLLLVLLLGLSIVGMTTAARAEEPAAAPVGTVGDPFTYDDPTYFSLNGNTLTINQKSAGASLRYPVSEYEAGDVAISITADAAVKFRMFLTTHNDWGWCNVNAIDWVTTTANEAYTQTFDPTKFFTDAMRTAKAFDIVFQSEADVGTVITFNSIKLVEHVVPTEPEKVAIGEWTGGTAVTVTKDGTIEAGDKTYTGMKVSWTKEVATDNHLSATVTAFDASKTGKLRISFYTDSKIRFKVFDGANNALLNEEANPGDPDGSYYDIGYHVFDIDVSAAQNLNALWLYLDAFGGTLDFEGTKTVVFDQILFYDDVNVALDACVNNGGIFDVDTTDKLSLTWDAKDAVEKYPNIVIPVEHWQPSLNRYLILDMTLTESAQFRFFLNGGHFDQWGNPDEKSAFGNYVTYKKGRHVICFDTKAIFDAEMIEADGDNKLYIYCYGGTGAIESQNTVATFDRLEFGQTAVDAVALTVDVNYKAGTVDFDDTKIEVSKVADFSALLDKGGEVGPGTLYVRSKADNKVTTEIELKSAVLTAENVVQPIITDTSISYEHATDYAFKFGEDGEWGATKRWDNLEKETDYKIYIRKLPSETAFESNVLEVILRVNGAFVPVHIDLENGVSRSDFITLENEGDSVTLSYNAANINGNYYSVAFPVTNWRQGNRYLVIDLSCTESAKLRFYLNGNKFDQWGNPVDASAFTPDYTEYGKGRHLICLDTAALFAAGAVNADGDNNLIIFCDGGISTSVSVEKQITLSSVSFSQTEVAAMSLTLGVDYLTGVVNFDGEKLEVASSADFAEGTLIESGATVTIGKLYIRAKADPAFKTEIVLAKAELSTTTAPKALITASSISYEHVSGYEFKFGEDGEWGTTALWENLTADTEYTIYMRIPANEHSFGSDEIAVKVRTKSVPGATTPEEPAKKGCGCNGSVAAASLPFALLLLAACPFFLRRKRASK